MTLESALKGSFISFAVFVIVFGTASSFGMRVVHVVGWTLGWLLFSLVVQAIKEKRQ
jgi:hypothetical protein